MLNVTQKNATAPNRAVVIGGGGFVGSSICAVLETNSVEVTRMTRAEADLNAKSSIDVIQQTVNDGDVVVNAAAVAPCKDLDMLKTNIDIISNIQAGIAGKEIAHLVNISSDAVFGDDDSPITEKSPLAPGSFHGIMHLTREVAIDSEASYPVTHVRPTLIYGAGDPHNGYGPNRFARQALADENIPLFGKGEERRDHIFINDLVQIVWLVIAHRATGSVNLATGEVHSFHELAERVIKRSGASSELQYSTRNGPMPHNGYRPFDVSNIHRTFPEFNFTDIESGLTQLIEGLRDDNTEKRTAAAG